MQRFFFGLVYVKFFLKQHLEAVVENYTNFTHNALYQNCANCSAQLNKMIAMFDIILKNYLSSVLWHKFYEDIIMQTRIISL